MFLVLFVNECSCEIWYHKLSIPRMFHLSPRAWFADVVGFLAERLSMEQPVCTIAVTLNSWAQSASASGRNSRPSWIVAVEHGPTCCWAFSLLSCCRNTSSLGKLCALPILGACSNIMQKYSIRPVILSCVVCFNLRLKCRACVPASPHRACCRFGVYLVEGCHFGSSFDMITSETQQLSVITGSTLSYYPLLVLS